jgi:hypothetical protein
LELHAFPNPFNSTTSIYFTLSIASDIELMVVDILGRQVVKLAHDYYPVGRHHVTWSGLDFNNHTVSSGIYLIRLTTPQKTQSHKILFLK